MQASSEWNQKIGAQQNGPTDQSLSCSPVKDWVRAAPGSTLWSAVTAPVSWSALPGSGCRVPFAAEAVSAASVLPHGSSLPWPRSPAPRSTARGQVQPGGDGAPRSKWYCSSTDIGNNFPSEKCQSSKILQGRVSAVSSSDWSFLAPCPLARLLAIPSVPALHSASQFWQSNW